MRDSASQGALTHAVLGQQGLITEAGYQEQATSYQNMATAATNAGNAGNDAATFADITGGIKMIAGMATMFSGVGEVAAVGGAATSAIADCTEAGDPTQIGSLY